MSINYSVQKLGEDSPITMNQLDHELCELQGIEEDPEKYCRLFDLFTFQAVSQFNKDSESRSQVIPMTGIQEYLESLSDDSGLQEIARIVANTYKLTAWRE